MATYNSLPKSVLQSSDKGRELAAPVVIEKLPQVIFQTDNDGVIHFINSHWATLSGYAPEQCIDHSFAEYIHPQDRPLFASTLRAFAGTTDTAQISIRVLTQDGGTRQVELLANREAIDTHSGVVGTLVDITASEHAYKLLQAEYRTLDSLLTTLPAMVYRCRNNEHRTMEYVSAGSLALTGYRPEDLIDNTATSYRDLVHDSDRHRVLSEVQSAVSAGEVFDLNYVMTTRGGEEKWIWERGQGYFSSNGDLLGIEGYMSDMTRHRPAETGAALYDPDTGLPGAALFADRLQQFVEAAALHRTAAFSLLLVRVDGFTRIADQYGAQAAAGLVTEISLRIKDVLKPTDCMARLARNQLGIVQGYVHDVKEVTHIARRIQERVLLPVVIEEQEVFATASIGIALSTSSYQQGEDMRTDAATAVSRARTLGGARHEVFDLQMHVRAVAQSQMEDELERAISANELAVYWQPVLAISSGRIAGLEARIAWPHPRRGTLFAEDFVAYAENTQLILPLWDWMLSAACEQMQQWRCLPETEGLALGIQIYGKTLLDADSVLRLGEQLIAAKPEGFDLALGVTESVLSETPNAVSRMLERLQAKQIRLVLDEFGAGDSSLSMLRRMPIDLLKLDGALLSEDAHARAYMAGIAALAHRLGIQVIANGVETEAQLTVLREAGIDFAQGTLVSPPVDADSVVSMLRQ